MKTKMSFNLLMTNLFIGMVRGHRFLRPWSTQVKSLGYKLFQVEPRFTSKGGTVNPEAMAMSEKRGHCLLVEWTQMVSPDPRKEQQIVRYQQVTRTDLVDRAGVPSTAAGKNSTWLVLRSDNPDSYRRLIRSDSAVRLLISCADDACNQLKYAAGDVQDTELSGILKAGLCCSRIPHGYVRLSMENLSKEEYVEAVTQQVASFVAKRRMKFSGEDVCRALFDAWRTINPDKKQKLVNAVNLVMKECAKKEYCEDWLLRANDSPPVWEISVPKGRSLTGFYSNLKRFTCAITAAEFQLELFEP